MAVLDVAARRDEYRGNGYSKKMAGKLNPRSESLGAGRVPMPSPSDPAAPNGTSEQEPPSAGTGLPGDSRAPWRSGRPNTRRLGEVCPETVIIMPFAVPLVLTMRLRKWLRRRVGQKAGNVIGNVAIFAFAGPPLLVAFVTVLLLRLAIAVLDRLDRAARAWRGA